MNLIKAILLTVLLSTVSFSNACASSDLIVYKDVNVDIDHIERNEFNNFKYIFTLDYPFLQSSENKDFLLGYIEEGTFTSLRPRYYFYDGNRHCGECTKTYLIAEGEKYNVTGKCIGLIFGDDISTPAVPLYAVYRDGDEIFYGKLDSNKGIYFWGAYGGTRREYSHEDEYTYVKESEIREVTDRLKFGKSKIRTVIPAPLERFRKDRFAQVRVATSDEGLREEVQQCMKRVLDRYNMKASDYNKRKSYYEGCKYHWDHIFECMERNHTVYKIQFRGDQKYPRGLCK